MFDWLFGGKKGENQGQVQEGKKPGGQSTKVLSEQIQDNKQGLQENTQAKQANNQQEGSVIVLNGGEDSDELRQQEQQQEEVETKTGSINIQQQIQENKQSEQVSPKVLLEGMSPGGGTGGGVGPQGGHPIAGVAGFAAAVLGSIGKGVQGLQDWNHNHHNTLVKCGVYGGLGVMISWAIWKYVNVIESGGATLVQGIKSAYGDVVKNLPIQCKWVGFEHGPFSNHSNVTSDAIVSEHHHEDTNPWTPLPHGQEVH